MSHHVKQHKLGVKGLFGLFKDAFSNINQDYGFIFSAGLSYYGIFALPAILFIVIYIAGLVVSSGEVQQQILGKMGSILGPDTKEQLELMLSKTGGGGENIWMTILGIVLLIVSASVVISHLQKALNRIWEVKINPDAGIKVIILERLKSIAVVLGLGIFMLAFMIITSFLTGFSDRITEGMPEYMDLVFYAINFLISFGFIWLLFSILFKVVPDAEIKYKTVWIGAAITALLFVIGQFALSIYLAKSNPGESFGAAGPIIVIMVWMYYSAFITLFGAEITQVYSVKYGHGIIPSKYALKMDIELKKENG